MTVNPWHAPGRPTEYFFYGKLIEDCGKSSCMVIRAMADYRCIYLPMTFAHKIGNHHRLAETELPKPWPKVIHQNTGAG